MLKNFFLLPINLLFFQDSPAKLFDNKFIAICDKPKSKIQINEIIEPKV